MSKPKLILNIGYHKTATTWWQHLIFPHLKGINYIGRKYDGDPYLPRKGILSNFRIKSNQSKLLNDSLNNFTRNEKFAFEEEYKRIKDNAKIKSNQMNLISSENFLRPFCVARTLKRLSYFNEYFETKILVFIRRQDKIIMSRYLHDLTVKFGSKINYTINEALKDEDEYFCKWPFCGKKKQFICSCDKLNLKVITPNFYNYNFLYNQLLMFYEPQNIFFFPFEALRERNDKIIGDLFDFMEIKYSDQKHQKLLQQQAIGLSNSSLKSKIEESEKENLYEFCRSYYSVDNIQLAEKININLEKYGYSFEH